MMQFRNRQEAAHLLARRLSAYRGKNPLILAIPRGAVVMGRILAQELRGELDVVLVRKLGAPMHQELAIGSVDEKGHVFMTEYAQRMRVPEDYIHQEIQKQLQTMKERRRLYTASRAPINPKDRIVIVLDDGIATGSTMIAALKSLQESKPAKLIAAAAVAPQENIARVSPYADEVICLITPQEFYAVGQFYQDFGQVEDEEVIELLQKESVASDPEITIEVDGQSLLGNLTVPKNAKGLVLFAHGSGSSRLSLRNLYVAEVLHRSQIATFLFDLLTPEEDRYYENRFDIPRLARRLANATKMMETYPDVQGLPLAYFGASTGAAAALIAAAELQDKIQCVVSRGGRPDLAMEVLDQVTAPTLLIVGAYDDAVIALNRKAYAALTCEKELSIVPGATHLFEEPGTLEEAARRATAWFKKYLEKP